MTISRPVAAVAALSLAGTAVITLGGLAGPASARTDRLGTSGEVVRLYRTAVKPLATIGGVEIKGGAYGSSFVARPGTRDRFYGLTDRGPNVDGPNGTKIEPLPDFQPAIGEFRLVDNRAKLVRRIGLATADGTPYNGQTNPANPTNETITDLDGNVLPASPQGYDPEGLVALPDGTFWVSDEYGPFITHFDARGRAIERLSPTDGSLPAALAQREPNRGMEGLTVTPDRRFLVGIMQSGLAVPDGPAPRTTSAVRIVTVDLRTRETRQFVYVLHNTTAPSTGVSEISALSGTRFLVDERDGKVEPGANKKLYEIDLGAATNVDGFEVEKIAGSANTVDTTARLRAAGIEPVSSSLFLDVAGLVSSIDPRGYFFGHDKIEGVAVLDGGRRLLISNDNDFGIGGVAEDSPPYTLTPKLLPNGQQDDGELLEVRTGR